MFKKKHLILLFMVITLILAACGGDEEVTPEATVDDVVNINWLWAELTENEPASQSVVPDPENYTLVLGTDGQFSYQADCNSGSGSYSVDGNNLTLTLGPATLAECGPDSLSTQYQAFLGQVASFDTEEGRLVLGLAEDAGTMTFNNGGAPIAGDPVWQQIQSTGVMRVGTSADYAPFEYYDDTNQIDGFDIALIDEVAGLLGLEVLLNDFSFDGLGEALQINQIDVAVAAITITPERDAKVDFTNIYFVTNGAALTREDNQLNINVEDDLAPFRIGVQSGSTYDTFLYDTLIEPGKMPASNVFRYQRINEALPDLEAGLIDLVLADLQPAEAAEEEGGFVIVAEGINEQFIAMAIPTGATTLQAELNRALTELESSGRLAELAKEYMDIEPEDILPIPPQPTPVPPVVEPGPGCTNAMAYVQDLSYDDQNMTNPPKLAPGETFRKGWRLRNVGTCTWDSSYSLIPVTDNIMQAQPVAVQGTVSQGQTYDFYVDLIAPTTPGVYQEFFSMRSSSGTLFGQRIWAGIEVVAAPTPTPAATQTPSPDMRFAANPETIRKANVRA